MVVTYPIITTAPGLVASMWGTLVYSEVKGGRNQLTLVAALVVSIAGVVLIVMSR